jgi:glycerol-3-phosphate cytidylyltransferase
MCPSNLFAWSSMRYCFDIDGTLCHTPNSEKGKPDYLNAKPYPFMVEQINRLYDEGNYIIMQTARGKGSGIDHTELTTKQLNDWGYKYHELFPMFCKPNVDIFIDDKAVNVVDWAATQPKIRGIVAGAFDLIHPGYIRMFKECREHCNHLTIALHEDPSLDRPNKLSPVQTVDERKEILKSIKYIDDIVVYQAEDTFLSYLKDYDIRFLGDDYRDGSYTGKDINIKIVFIDRYHNYSTTELKRKILKSWR